MQLCELQFCLVKTELSCCCFRLGNCAVLKSLLSHGGSVDLKAQEDITPLYIAAWRGHKKTIELLINSGVSIQKLCTCSPCHKYICATFSVLSNGEAVAKTPAVLESGFESSRPMAFLKSNEDIRGLFIIVKR